MLPGKQCIDAQLTIHFVYAYVCCVKVCVHMCVCVGVCLCVNRHVCVPAHVCACQTTLGVGPLK